MIRKTSVGVEILEDFAISHSKCLEVTSFVDEQTCQGKIFNIRRSTKMALTFTGETVGAAQCRVSMCYEFEWNACSTLIK